MNNVSGKILVVGYSDNVPIRSARFASNYELSLERARSVQKMLQGSLSQPGRVKAEGRGEINPVAPNTTPENRARNRRVEITLLVSPENTQAELNGLPQGTKGMLTTLLSILTNRILWSFLGVTALAAVIWMIGPLLSIVDSRPLESEQNRIISIAVVYLLWAQGHILPRLYNAWLNRKLMDNLQTNTAEARNRRKTAEARD